MKELRTLAGSLETANFVQFWGNLKELAIKERIQKIGDFEPSIREFIADVFSITYQRVSKSLLVKNLGQSEEEFEKFAEQKAWKIEDEEVSIPLNPNNQSKPAKAPRPITVRQITNMLATTVFNK